MTNFKSCPRCHTGQLVSDRRTSELSCLACGYEYIESTPINWNPDLWAERVSLPVYDPDKENNEAQYFNRKRVRKSTR